MHKFTVKEAILFGWYTYKKNWKFFLILFLMVWGAYTILSWVVAAASEQFALIGLPVRIGASALETIIWIGLVKIAIDFAAHKNPDYKDIYTHYKLFWKYLGGVILYSLIVLGGFILLVIPGIYWAVKYHFVLYLVVDRGMGPVEALKKSGKITEGVKMKLLMLGIILTVFNMVGALFFGIGLLITIPISLVAVAHVYKKLT